MFRYLTLFYQFFKFSFLRATAFRFDFWCRVLMDVVYYGITFLFFKLLFLQTPNLGGWTESQIMIFIGVEFVIDALQMTFISGNLWSLPSAVNKGEIDYYLVKPISSLFFISCKDIAINSFVNVIVAIGFLSWALIQYPEPFSFGRLLLFFLMIANGLGVFYCLRLLFCLPVFWTNSPFGMERIFYSLMIFAERPHTIFRGSVKLFITLIVPFAVVASFPAQVFFEGASTPLIVHCIGIFLIFALCTRFVWRGALRAYSSASS